MAWMAETFARRADPKVLWPEARSVVMLAMNYGPAVDPLEALRRRELRRDLGLRAPSRLSRRDQGSAEDARAAGSSRTRAREAREVKVFVDTAPVMEKPLAAAAGLGWQGKHTNLVSRAIRLLAVSRRDLHRSGASARRGRERPLRRLPRLPRRLPDARLLGALSARRAPLRLLSHDRAQGADRAGVARARSAIASTAATIAWRSARGTSSRARGARPSSQRARISPPRRSPNSPRSTTPGFRAPLRRRADQANRPCAVPAQRDDRDRQFRRSRADRGRRGLSLRRSRRWCAQWRSGRSPDFARARSFLPWLTPTPRRNAMRPSCGSGGRPRRPAEALEPRAERAIRIVTRGTASVRSGASRRFSASVRARDSCLSFSISSLSWSFLRFSSWSFKSSADGCASSEAIAISID